MRATQLAVWSSGMIPASGAGGPGLNSRNSPIFPTRKHRHARTCKPTPVGFEPTRADPIGLAGRRLNHSAKVSLARLHVQPSSHHCPYTHQAKQRAQHAHCEAARRQQLQASGPVAQWIRHRPTEPGISGSTPAGVICAPLRQPNLEARTTTDTEGIRTPAGRAQWMSSPFP